MDRTDGPAHEHGARVLRIKLPVSYHLRLHRIKLETGRSMAEVVKDALALYFSNGPEADEPRPRARTRATLGSDLAH